MNRDFNTFIALPVTMEAARNARSVMAATSEQGAARQRRDEAARKILTQAYMNVRQGANPTSTYTSALSRIGAQGGGAGIGAGPGAARTFASEASYKNIENENTAREMRKSALEEQRQKESLDWQRRQRARIAAAQSGTTNYDGGSYTFSTT